MNRGLPSPAIRLFRRKACVVKPSSIDELDRAIRLTRPRNCRNSVVESAGRSEKHTSELQSPDHLVCRLLLEKKQKHPRISHITRPPATRATSPSYETPS